MKRPSPLVLGLLLGLLFTLVLNASSLRAWSRQQLTVADLGAEIGSIDETYYFALINDVRDGHLNLGNTSLFEYQNAPAVAGFALLPQGLVARFTTLDLATVILLGDLLFPLLICCFAFLIFRRFLRSDIVAAGLALSFMCWWATGWQRSMHPQVTMTVFLLSLLTFISDLEGKKMYQRGLCLFLLLLVQPIHAAYMLTVEGIDTLMHWKRTKSLTDVIRRRWPLAVYVLAAGILHVGLQQSADSGILAETYRRRGLIFSHLPTAPQTQILFLILLALSIWMIRTKRATDSLSRCGPVLLIAGLVVLNQSLVHGYDAVFGLYYRLPLLFILWLSVAWVIARILPPSNITQEESCSLSNNIFSHKNGLQHGNGFLHGNRFLPGSGFLPACLVAFVLMFTGFHLWQEMQITVPKSIARSQEFQNSDLRAVMQELTTHSKTEVVLAPIEISNLVPVLTPHYALFTQYAHFEYASDLDLAQRYLLQRSLFPLPSEQTVEGDPLVFGIFAGNAYARAKTMCRLRLTTVGCDKKLSDFIADQSVRAFVDAGNIDELALLRKFGVTTVVTDKALPDVLGRFCKDPVRTGRYSIFSCRFTNETVIGI